MIHGPLFGDFEKRLLGYVPEDIAREVSQALQNVL